MFHKGDHVHILTRPAAFPYEDVRKAFMRAGMVGEVVDVSASAQLPICVQTPDGKYHEYFADEELELVEQEQAG